jgi:hypothetical protein
MPRKFLARQVRQRYRIKQMSAWPVHQQKPTRLAATTYRAGQSGQSGRSWFLQTIWQAYQQAFWEALPEIMWSLLLAFMYEEFLDKSVKTMEKSQVK